MPIPEMLTAVKASIPPISPPFWECCFKPIILAHPVVAIAVVSGSLIGAGSYYILNKPNKPEKIGAKP